MGAEEQKEAAQAEAQRWRATLDKQDLKLASLRLKHKASHFSNFQILFCFNLGSGPH